jgi:hypothetical protein
MAGYSFVMNWMLFCAIWLVVIFMFLRKIGDYRDGS